MIQEIVYASEEAVAIITLLVAIPTMIAFIDFLFKKDELLDWYYKWLIKKWDYYEAKKSWKRKLLKPIGLCPYCMQPWLAFLYAFLFTVNIKYLLIIIPINYLFLRLYFKWFDDGR